MTSDIRTTIRHWLLSELLPGESPDNLPDDLDLHESGLLDSLTTLALVEMLENTFDIEVRVDESGPATFGTVTRLVAYVGSKVCAEQA
jgi:acyl carrier protein